jgi:hypothetical protein
VSVVTDILLSTLKYNPAKQRDIPWQCRRSQRGHSWGQVHFHGIRIRRARLSSQYLLIIIAGVPFHIRTCIASYTPPLTNPSISNLTVCPQITCIPTIEWFAIPSRIPYRSSRSKACEYPNYFQRYCQNRRLGSCEDHLPAPSTSLCRRQSSSNNLVSSTRVAHGC